MIQENIFLGFTFVILAGVFAGAFALPMKYTTGWKWEHNWLAYTAWATIVMPLAVAFITVPGLMSIYQDSDPPIMLKAFLSGLAWGIGMVCFGLGLHYLGVALGLSIMLGLVISLGALLPIIIFHPAELSSQKGQDIIRASVVILAGIIVCAMAGSMRDRQNKNASAAAGKNMSKFWTGLIIAMMAGLLSPIQNIGFVAADPLKESAIAAGVNPLFTGNVVWPFIMIGCFIPNLAYCSYLISKNREWRLFISVKKWYWPAIASTGIMWFLCMMFFGMAAAKLGKLGPSIGFAAFQTLAIVTGNVVGLMTGEWKGATRFTKALNVSGILILVAGVIIISF
jgi:L-rhamnose-H+ transport protein